MNPVPISRYDFVAWTLFGGGLLLLLPIDLLPALLAGLLVYSLVNALVPTLRVSALGRRGPRLLAVTLITAAVITLLAMAGLSLTSFLRASGENIPALIQRMAEIIENSRERLPAWAMPYVPGNTEELNKALVEWLRSHAATFQVAGTGLGRALAHVLIGMVVGALLSLETAIHGGAPAPLAAAFAKRALLLSHAFRRVVFAQVWISAINSMLTALYLTVALPLFHIEMPFAKTLIMITFVVGLLPIVGNLISNTVIFVVSLSQSLTVALASLAYLIAIHKLEYFLNARIVGSHIRAQAWEMLIAMVAMEAAFGIPGLIAAPIYYAYMKDELRAQRLVA